MTEGQANERADTFQPDGTELDFWIGDRDVRWGDSGRGTNRLTRILRGRVIREEFSGVGPKASLGRRDVGRAVGDRLPPTLT